MFTIERYTNAYRRNSGKGRDRLKASKYTYLELLVLNA